MNHHVSIDAPHAIAVVGLGGRFPGAADVDALWSNLRAGVESIARFDADDLRAEGLSPDLLDAPDHVPSGGALDGIELFDASFFGFNPREAEVLDPQHRVFLECCWEALERAGHAPSTFEGAIGVYAGAGASSHLHRLLADPEVVRLLGSLQLTIGNEKDHLTTRVAYKLGLRGPAVTVQTTCSSSLVAVCLACQGLATGQCDLALAGGVSIVTPQRTGYRYRKGGILSPDGHCRAFDAEAAGAVGGNGAGVVVLRRLAEALADGDHVHAVLRGSALNNDGSLKIGYTAPGIDGQAAVIRRALASASLSPEDISYVEAHGTGTPLGDPIEVAALTEAFGGRRPGAPKTCAIGSVKTNIGHLDAAAGVVGLIKTVLALEHEELPSSLHFHTPNPELRLSETPFTVLAERTPWRRDDTPRRAGVSSFGIGGTNAHVVVEEAPPLPAAPAGRPWPLLVVSARSAGAADRAAANLADHLERRPEVPLEHVAFTLQAGRQAFGHRRAVVSAARADAVACLRGWRRLAGDAHDGTGVAFLFPGQGAQWPGMARVLHAEEPGFRESLDACISAVGAPLGGLMRDLLLGEPTAEATAALTRTELAQPALFMTELALADLWASWGVRPNAMLGHSVGELVAACLAGVLSREDALSLAVQRGRLMEAMAPGAMLAVGLPEAVLRGLLPDGIEIAAVNAPALCTVAASTEAIATLEPELAAQGATTVRLRVSHAFHSAAMADAADAFARAVAQVELRPPVLPYLSNLTGDWATAELATDPTAWGSHVRQPVRFADGAHALLATGSALLEVGPGGTLGTLVRSSAPPGQPPIVVASLPGAKTDEPVGRVLAEAVGRLWVAGAGLDLRAYANGRPTGRTPLPTYPFERSRYWLETRSSRAARPGPTAAGGHGERRPREEWLSVPSWRRTAPSRGASSTEEPHSLLLLADDEVAASRLAGVLRGQGRSVVVRADAGDPAALLAGLDAEGRVDAVVHLATCAGIGTATAVARVLNVVRALAATPTVRRQYVLVTDCAVEVTGTEAVRPEQAALHGLARVVAQEHPGLTCRIVDVVAADLREDPSTATLLANELGARTTERSIALRGGHRWLPGFEPLAVDTTVPSGLCTHGTYLITGGLGRIGLTLAERLARRVGARLVLVSRTELPRRQDWGEAAGGPGRVAAILRALAVIERVGGETLPLAADLSDTARMAEVLAEAERRFGPLDGVIHAAGAVGPEAFAAVTEVDDALVRRHFAPKVDGTLALDALLRDRPPALAMLVSSLSAVLGGLGFGPYAAANAFLDAFAAGPGRGRWTSVGWEGWRFGSPSEAHGLAALALSPDEGADVFERLAGLPRLPHVVVSTGDLDARVRTWVGLRGTSLEQDVRATGRPGQGRADESPDAPTNSGLAAHPRPDLDTAYVEPTTNGEHVVAAAWQELLGIARVGRHDDFFALGGHSLLAIQLISRLRDVCGVELSVHSLFDGPTVAELAAQVEAAQATATAAEEARLAELLDLVEGLSEEEVEALLAEEGVEHHG